jgi:hypothetical protein
VRVHDVFTAIAGSALGIVSTLLFGADGVWIIIGAVAGLAFGIAVVVLRIRTIVALSVALGTVIGAIVGKSIVHALCLPSECPAAEGGAAVVTAIGAFIGVGLVVALATRSFDEHREAINAGRPPPTPGCETGDNPSDL